ncbi:MAG: SusE domain-containing protein [Oligoflexus sp.]|nr:SusE domain-containing protein [Pseudopedobacter sp.]
MKNILKITFFALLLISIGSCTNDQDPVATANGLNLKAITPSSPFVLSPVNGDNDVATITWDAVDNGVPTGPSVYVVEIAKSGTNFAKPIIASPISTDTSFLWKEGYLNSLLLANGFLPELAADIDVRVKSTLGIEFNTFVQYSNIIAIKVTPFSQSTFAFAKVGADPSLAPKTLSAGFFTTDTEGYSWLEAGDYKFYTSVQNKFAASNPFYGNDGSGALVLNGKAINIATAGYYRIMADNGAIPKTYSLTLITAWGIIGDAKVFGALNSLPPMTYNQAENKWKIVINLKGGKSFKFRANNSNVINLGTGDAGAGTPEYAGAVMKYNGATVPVPGLSTSTVPYIVTLDLSSPRNYTYTMVKQ